MTEKFKTALFGYSKREVCEYISEVSDDLTAKHNNEKKELTDRIKALEAENKRLSQEKSEAEKKLAQISDDNAKVSEIIIDARRFADELKAKAAEQNKKEMEENSRCNADVADRIKDSMRQVEEIRTFLHKFLEGTDTELSQIEKNLNGVELVTE